MPATRGSASTRAMLAGWPLIDAVLRPSPLPLRSRPGTELTDGFICVKASLSLNLERLKESFMGEWQAVYRPAMMQIFH